MKNIAWAGGTDIRHLSPEDLAKAGVEISESITFPHHEPVEVSNAFADAVMRGVDLFGPFIEVAVDQVTRDGQLDLESLEKEDPKPSTRKANK